MITPTLYQAYKAARRHEVTHEPLWLPATQAIIHARYAAPQVCDLDDAGNAQIEHDGFTLTIQVRDDEDADRSHYGELGNDPYSATGSALHVDRVGGYEWRRGRYKYFYPQQSVQEVRDQLTHLGKHAAYVEAWRQVRAEYKELTDPSNAYLWARVTASREGVELAAASLGGIELASSHTRFYPYDSALRDPYLQECLADLVNEAVDAARVALRALVASMGQLELPLEVGA